MEVVRTIQKGGIEIIIGTELPVCDPAATEAEILKLLPKNMTDAELNSPISIANVMQYNDPEKAGTGFFVTDAEAAVIEGQLASLADHQVLAKTPDKNGQIVPDFLDVEYQIKRNSRWEKEKMTECGVALPLGAVMRENLTEAQNKEIREQEEADRLSALTPEQKAAEKQSALDALADEADRLARRAQIQGTEFDPVAYYNEKAPAIEAKYAE
jgi:hypothetical protein